MKSREWALQVLNEVIINGAYANIALDQQHRKNLLDGKERSFAVELSRGTIKAWGTLDWMLSFYLSRPIQELPPVIGNILRLGFFQVFFLPKIPVSAASNESVELAKKYGHPGTVKLVNAIMRSAVREPEKIKWPCEESEPIKYLARKYYHPVWVVKRWFEELGFEETEALLECNNQAPALGIRAQRLKNSPEECFEKLSEEGFEIIPSEWVKEGCRVISHPPLGQSVVLRLGFATIQDEGAMLISHLVDPQPGEVILDACAAPGGKSTHLAELMKDQGTVISQDIHTHKISLIEGNAKKMGLCSIRAILGDATQVHLHKEKYDRILVDVPCSGLGTIGRRADTRWRKSEQQIKEITELQFEILSSCAKALKNGGRLVYSTCTLTPEENEQMVVRFLAENPDFSLLPVKDILPKFSEDYLKLWPHKTRTDGFFAACLVKNERTIAQ